MTQDLYVFFDECGDEGLRAKSSEWFILSAAIQPGAHADLIRAAYSDYRTSHRKHDNWHFHFVNASHQERLTFISHMLPLPYLFMSVAIHKPSIERTDNFSLPYYMYFYAARLVIERASWYARDRGARIAGLHFSSRRGLTEDATRRYLKRLRDNHERGLVNSIHWPALHRHFVKVLPNKELIGLQMADLMASSFGQAVALENWPVTEPRYLLALKERIYRNNGTRLRYGLKFFPRLTQELRDQERFAWVSEIEARPQPPDRPPP